MPKVTAIIPCHNHQDWVCEAIQSIINQTHKNLELIVVNDGSTDDSFQNMIDYLDADWDAGLQDPPVVSSKFQIPITIYNTYDAQGPSYARNLGMKNASPDTEYFAFLDSDDLYHPDKIEKSLALFDENVAVVYSDYNTFNNDGFLMRHYKEPFSRRRLLQECLPNCDSLISKKAVEACGFFDESLRVCEDYDYWMRLSERFVLRHLPEALVDIRMGEHSSTNTVKSQVWHDNYKRVFEKVAERAAV